MLIVIPIIPSYPLLITDLKSPRFSGAVDHDCGRVQAQSRKPVQSFKLVFFIFSTNGLNGDWPSFLGGSLGGVPLGKTSVCTEGFGCGVPGGVPDTDESDESSSSLWWCTISISLSPSMVS